MLSLVIPVYQNEANVDALLDALLELAASLPEPLEVVFVVDGSPDRCLELLRERLPGSGLRSRVALLSRNFGSFAAISAGLALGTGEWFAVLAADLQEPPQLVAQFLEVLRNGEADVVFGHRLSRADPLAATLFSSAFWWLYRRFVLPDLPRGGVDVFGCNRRVRDELLKLPESGSNLIAQLFWLGFRRKFISYARREREQGRSAWTMLKKLRYSLDSIFNFTDLPLLLLLVLGAGGVLASVLGGIVVLTARLAGSIAVPGYTPIVLAISFFGGLTTLSLGVVGQYVRLAMENARRRPNFVIQSVEDYSADRNGSDPFK